MKNRFTRQRTTGGAACLSCALRSPPLTCLRRGCRGRKEEWAILDHRCGIISCRFIARAKLEEQGFAVAQEETTQDGRVHLVLRRVA